MTRPVYLGVAFTKLDELERETRAARDHNLITSFDHCLILTLTDALDQAVRKAADGDEAPTLVLESAK